MTDLERFNHAMNINRAIAYLRQRLSAKVAEYHFDLRYNDAKNCACLMTFIKNLRTWIKNYEETLDECLEALPLEFFEFEL